MKKILFLIITLIIGYTAISLFNDNSQKLADDLKQPIKEEIKPVVEEDITKDTYLNNITYKVKSNIKIIEKGNLNGGIYAK